MDQAGPVADLAGSTVPELGPDATGAQKDEAKGKQKDIDEAQGTLDGAKRLAADAKALREGGASTLRSELENVSVVPERSIFEKFLEWFKENPIFQVILGLVIAVVSIFFPVVGFVLGAAFFGLMTGLNFAASGKMDWGAFAIGLLTLGFGGAMAAIRNIAKVGELVGKVTTPVSKMFTSATGKLGTAVKGWTTSLKNNFPNLTVGLKTFGETTGSGLVINLIGGGINKKVEGDDVPYAAIFAGAFAGGLVGGAGAGGISRYMGKGSVSGLFGGAPKKPFDPGSTTGKPPPLTPAKPLVPMPASFTKENTLNAVNAVASSTADSGAKVSESMREDPDQSPDELGVQEGVGGQAGMGAGSLGNYKPKGK
jgi:hypothetical protein